MQGFIQIHRKLMKHWVLQSPGDTHKWVIMLIQVNYARGKISLGNKVFTIGRGQSAYSYATWASLFGCHKNTIRPFFEKLASDGMISFETLGSGKYSTTLITILNYHKYQTPLELKKDSLGDEIVPQDVSQTSTQQVRKLYTNKKEKEEYNKEYRHIVDVLNRKLGLSYGYVSNLLESFIQCRQSYSLDQIEKAISNYNTDFWSKSLNPGLLFKTTTNSGDSLDIIGQLLSHQAELSELQRRRQL
jgi:AraC-like DNA-binding protein